MKRRFPLCLDLVEITVRNCSGKAEWNRRKDRKFIDWKKVRVYGGKGGHGLVSFKQATSSKVMVGGPDGGDGGDGGNVGFVVDPSTRSLRSLRTHYRARDGEHGQGSYHTGKSGKNVMIKVPRGTLIREHPSKTILYDLMDTNSTCLVANGGEGGLGNAIFSSTMDRKPMESTEGEPGEEKVVEVELRTIADVGLVGFPNAGKSTLLRALSRATPKVAEYPFTTLNPQVGVVERGGEEEGHDVTQISIADIPGLMTDAHVNRGLGHAFLRHIQRCLLLMYVLDSSDTHTTMADQLRTLQQELSHFDSTLLQNGCLVIANKMDLHCKMENGGKDHSSSVGAGFERELLNLQESSNLPVIPISALSLWNIGPLKEELFRMYTSAIQMEHDNEK